MREKLMRFMQGRYGNDNLNRFLLWVTVICFVISIFGGKVGLFFDAVGIFCLIYTYYRMLSRKTYKRARENRVYMNYAAKVKFYFAGIKNRFKENKTYHIYKCSQCGQKIRIPRGKGKIEIRCPKCNHTFIKKS